MRGWYRLMCVIFADSVIAFAAGKSDQRAAEHLPRPIGERRTLLKKILLMNGPNLNMLGVRDPAIYGTDTLEAIEEMVRAYGAEHGCEVDCFQSNHEGALIDRLHAAHGNYDGIVYNPGAHTHYSYALHDAVVYCRLLFLSQL